MIVFNNWCIENVGDLGHQYDNLSRILLVRGVPDGYKWQMNIKAGDNFDVIDLAQMEDGIGFVLTKEHLSVSGYYEMQLVGTLLSDGVTVRHTNVIWVFVPSSLSGDAHWPTVPSEFTQAEQRIRELSEHPSIPGNNGYWLVWDTDKGTYLESAFPLPDVSAGPAGKDGQDGAPGKDGKDGVGIQSVEQTTTSTEDGGTNIVTVTRTDGTASTFEVRNGSRGSAGPAGADGKDGAKGPAGADGYTPVRGTDYWTADDIAAIQSYVDEAILGGAW